MNEKLREEIEQSFLENDCRVAECTGLSYSTFERIAEHFYKFALADVKDEIARLMRETDCKNIRGHAAMRAYNEVFDFLDEQSK